MTNKILSSLKVITLAVVLSFGLSYVYAWTAPTVVPTGGNVSAPLNTSGAAQSKAGSLGIGMTTTPPPATKLQVSNGNIQFDIPATSLANALITWPGGSPNFRLTDSLGVEKINVNSQNGGYTYFNAGNVGIGTASPLRPLHVNGELSLSRSDNVGFINISNESGNGGGTLYLRGLNNNGSVGTPATIILDGTTYVTGGGLYVNGTPITGGGAISCTWTGERWVWGNGGGCNDDRGVTCTGGVVTSMRMGC